MLTPIDFKNNYFALLAESEQITGVRPDNAMFWRNDDIFNSGSSITAEQWSNLVRVASIIKSNQNRFDMNAWHAKNSCGTSHCIAGYAHALYMNDIDYYNHIEPSDILVISTNMLSHYAQPFFWILHSNLNLKTESYKGLPEQLVMKWFIDPILEEARKESHQLSSEITQFVQKSQQEQMATCGV
jgi:hypothetical protein